jgi:hypothetical protein
MNNMDLYNDLDKIRWNQESIENDITKMAVSRESDFNLDFPYLIDVEDTSYSYDNEKERDEDFESLCKILTENTTKYFYP